MSDKVLFIDDSELAIPFFSEVCTYCKHVVSKRKCKAFGDNDIPMEIWMGQNDHTKPVDGDNGIQFELWSKDAQDEKQD